MDNVIRDGNVLRREEAREENLSTADIANPDLRKRGPEAVRDDVQRRDEFAGSTADIAGNRNAVQRSSAGQQGQHDAPLFPENELNDFRGRWDRVQTGFVDEPRSAVEQADSLVASVVKRIAEQFANERAELEKQWDKGGDVSTEDLRQALRRYRAFFDRLLSF